MSHHEQNLKKLCEIIPKIIIIKSVHPIFLWTRGMFFIKKIIRIGVENIKF